MSFQELHRKDKISEGMPQETVPAGMPASLESWWRTQSATMALLKHAHSQREGAEDRIRLLEKRIHDLENLAATDPLTGLMNRRGFEQFFNLEMSRIRRNHSSGALLVMIDLDHFKEINDSFGHAAGDACLKLAAETLQRCIRISDGAARFGGDEFVLLLTQADAGKAMTCAEKLRRKMDHLQIEWEGRMIKFGASVGMTPVSSEDGDFMRRADLALYQDKQRRRSSQAL